MRLSPPGARLMPGGSVCPESQMANYPPGARLDRLHLGLVDQACLGTPAVLLGDSCPAQATADRKRLRYPATAGGSQLCYGIAFAVQNRTHCPQGATIHGNPNHNSSQKNTSTTGCGSEAGGLLRCRLTQPPWACASPRCGKTHIPCGHC